MVTTTNALKTIQNNSIHMNETEYNWHMAAVRFTYSYYSCFAICISITLWKIVDVYLNRISANRYVRHQLKDETINWRNQIYMNFSKVEPLSKVLRMTEEDRQWVNCFGLFFIADAAVFSISLCLLIYVDGQEKNWPLWTYCGCLFMSAFPLLIGMILVNYEGSKL